MPVCNTSDKLGLSLPRFVLRCYLFNTPTFMNRPIPQLDLAWTYFKRRPSFLRVLLSPLTSLPPILHEQLKISGQACQGGRLVWKGLDGRFSSLTHPEYDLSESRIPAAQANTAEILSLTRFRDTPASMREASAPYSLLNERCWFIHFCFRASIANSNHL
jgi:hypothetical protein